MFALEAPRSVPPPVKCVPRLAWRDGSTPFGERTLAEEVPVAFSYVRRETEGEFRPARGDIPFSAVRGSGLSPIALLLVD